VLRVRELTGEGGRAASRLSGERPSNERKPGCAAAAASRVSGERPSI
jgi:hypothetical protein